MDPSRRDEINGRGDDRLSGRRWLRPNSVTLVRTLAAAILCALLLAATPVPPDWSKAQTVTIVGKEYGFEPNKLTFQVGARYRLRFENRGNELHELTAPAFLQTVELGNPDVLNADRTEIVVHPGEQKELVFVPMRAGRYPFICADHDWAGMTGEIVVE
jgi:plastocyanin